MEQEGRKMSECVVRMEMPQNCQRCELFALCTEKCKNEVVRFDGKNIDKKDRRCLFICQLPEGHGRLVDIDKPFLNVLKTCMGTAKYQATIAERLDMCSVLNVEIIVPAEAERSEA
jgi:nicotinate-nucleotide pyrophosphorylase